ncbi:MAG: ferredoxin, partial [Chlorobiaceae bacterium]|nr:ferredoxin [Chlorobiaceae bacterium]
LYSAKMGWEALVKFPETVVLQTERIINGKLDIWQLFTDIIGGIGDVLQLLVQSIQGNSTDQENKSLPERSIPKGILAHNATCLTPANCGCNSNGNGKGKTVPHTITSHGVHNGVPA